MSIGSIGYTGYTQYTASYIAKQASASKSGFSGAVEGAETAAGTKKVTESAVDAFKKKHPDDAAHVNSQVKAGKKGIGEKRCNGCIQRRYDNGRI